MMINPLMCKLVLLITTHNFKDEIHLELPITDDLDQELEDFARLRRLGHFKAAKEIFKNSLEEHLGKPYVFIQYAEMLFEMGDYKSLRSLNPEALFGPDINRPTFSKRRWMARGAHTNDAPTRLEDEELERVERSRFDDGRNGRRDDEPRNGLRYANLSTEAVANRRAYEERLRKEEELIDWEREQMEHARRTDTKSDISDDELAPKAPFRHSNHNWSDRHLPDRSPHSTAQPTPQIHRGAPLDEAEQVAVIVLTELEFGPDLGSTEVQIISLTLRICGYIKNSLPDTFIINIKPLLDDWVDWADFASLYKCLVSQDRVWDFRDLAAAAFSVYGPSHWKKLTQGQINEDAVIKDFAENLDEVSCLALLDLLASNTLESDITADALAEVHHKMSLNSEYLAEFMMKNYPETIRSRAFTLWILTKAAKSGWTQRYHLGKYPIRRRRQMSRSRWPWI
ncbi:hypothetical protein GQ53DRAFT_765218 [Thozetella sp. PMI_491]|nr:hypothetical protein GQ53DRAFT_765218 [Thozetella sp. PMI_491]